MCNPSSIKQSSMNQQYAHDKNTHSNASLASRPPGSKVTVPFDWPEIIQGIALPEPDQAPKAFEALAGGGHKERTNVRYRSVIYTGC